VRTSPNVSPARKGWESKKEKLHRARGRHKAEDGIDHFSLIFEDFGVLMPVKSHIATLTLSLSSGQPGMSAKAGKKTGGPARNWGLARHVVYTNYLNLNPYLRRL
jgi:hypothetical protein